MQLEFLPQKDLRMIKARSHGGMSLKKRAKVARPLVPNCDTHVVFKSSKALGHLSFYTHKRVVADLLKQLSRKYFIELTDWVNMGNHLHLRVCFKDRERFRNFLRAFAGQLARKITKAHRGTSFGKFWDGLVYTRVLLTKLEGLGLKGYFEANHRERELGSHEREAYLQHFNRFLYRLRQVKAAPKATALPP